MIGSDQIVAWHRVLFEALIQQARTCGNLAQFEEVLQWNSVAGWFASRKGWFGELCSCGLESELLRAARSLPIPPRPPGTRSRPRWLHVLTEAYGTLGHTNLCRRWIQNDAEVVHDVILLNQRGEAPGNLVAAVKKSGGNCVVLDAAAPLLERAEKLRTHAWQNADVVVLHTHPEDVIATTAFGVAGGPPVLFLNHADHAFWIGCSIADLVLDIRISGHLWTKQARGVGRATILPLPLLSSEDAGAGGMTRLQRKREVRRKLGLPEDATILLTVGSAAKYAPIPGLNFVNAAVEIVRQCENVWLVAVGPRDEGAWRAAKNAVNGRILAVGHQPDSTLFCQAADLYLEGFPAGSLTALLEAGEAGLPCVRAPFPCIPPFTSDAVGVDDLPQPKDVNEYVRIAMALAQDETLRTELGRKLQSAIRSQHCGAGWLANLRQVKQRIPEFHSVHEDFHPVLVDKHRLNWSVQYAYANKPAPTRKTMAAGVFVEAWRQTAGNPQVDEVLWARLKACQTDDIQTAGGRPNLRERVSLWRLNAQIRRQGIRARFIASANLALARGKRDLARKLVYSCLVQSLSSAIDLVWIKMLIKSHLSSERINGLKRALGGKA